MFRDETPVVTSPQNKIPPGHKRSPENSCQPSFYRRRTKNKLRTAKSSTLAWMCLLTESSVTYLSVIPLPRPPQLLTASGIAALSQSWAPNELRNPFSVSAPSHAKTSKRQIETKTQHPTRSGPGTGLEYRNDVNIKV